MASPTAEKRKAGADSDEANKKQKTIEDSMGIQSNHKQEVKDTDGTKDSPSKANGSNHKNADAHKTSEAKKENGPSTTQSSNGDTKNAFDEVKSSEEDVKHAAADEQESKTKEIHEHAESTESDPAREKAVPSSIMEKGIIYFFFRGRVGVEDPSSVDDIARSYIVLRPLPRGAKLGQGPLEDTKNGRVLAVPKKVLPKGGNDKFLVFVNRKGLGIEDLREVFKGNEYATKTAGTNNTPAATPIAEGVYALTMTGNTSHLAYQITIPSEIGEVQKELGVYARGSFACSVKNPTASGPANASLDNPAEYSEAIMKKFGGRRWCPMEPEMLDYENTQMLLIGEGVGDTDKALEEQAKDQKNDDKDKPIDEMEKLGDEDHERVEGLKEDDPVFADLGLSSKEYPHLQTTW